MEELLEQLRSTLTGKRIIAIHPAFGIADRYLIYVQGCCCGPTVLTIVGAEQVLDAEVKRLQDCLNLSGEHK